MEAAGAQLPDPSPTSSPSPSPSVYADALEPEPEPEPGPAFVNSAFEEGAEDEEEGEVLHHHASDLDIYIDPPEPWKVASSSQSPLPHWPLSSSARMLLCQQLPISLWQLPAQFTSGTGVREGKEGR